jgi:hypothetical protein
MSDKKYCIFHIDGGVGKHIAATAVAKCIKNNYPDRELIVVCAWPGPFINLNFVDRVYRQGNTPYFYDDYIRGKDSLIFKHEPYFTTEHIHGQLPLVENWCKLYQLKYNGEKPELAFNLREKQIMQTQWKTPNKPMLLLQTSGGLFQEENTAPYKWTRDMPIYVMNRIVKEFGDYYDIFAITRPGAYTPEGMTRIDQPLSVMELATILPCSKKRLFIDSSMQHGAAALGLSSTVLWIGTNPKIFGYDLHDNIVADRPNNFKLPDSYLFDYNFDGVIHECPYKNDDEIFDVKQIIDSVNRQGF